MMRVLLDPGDDEPRLRYAELVGGERGEFVRETVAEERGEFVEPWRKKLWLSHREEWFLKPPFTMVQRYAAPEHWGSETVGIVSRGFISHIACTWEQFQAIAPTMLWWPPRTCGACDGRGTSFETGSEWACSAC